MNVLNGYDGVFMTKIEIVEMFVEIALRISIFIWITLFRSMLRVLGRKNIARSKFLFPK